ncbi:hypothetical protein [Winogradskyella sp. 3972H.M.0a.05]|uniref:hypothetical protein n=1 Tax=Winogradskyella sp. 3972H.M.0a.05 TaxID=2950277 RepID=UPI003393D57F
MKKTGIWMDQDRAFIVSLINDKEIVKTFSSGIEHFNVHGGSGTKFKGGPQDVVQDSKYLEREKHQFRNYFKSLIPELIDCDKLVLFGPADTVNKFSKTLEENYRDLFKRLLGVHKTDSMTDNQMRAWVRDFYNHN